MNRAVATKCNWCGSNTQVTYNENTDCSQVRLHGHLIATLDHSTKAVKLDYSANLTVTTKSRLNALLEEVNYGAKVFQKQFEWFVSYRNQTTDFMDGMILLNADSLQTA